MKSIARDVSAETVEFLREWLTHHIATIDMAYVPYLKRRKLDAVVTQRLEVTFRLLLNSSSASLATRRRAGVQSLWRD